MTKAERTALEVVGALVVLSVLRSRFRSAQADMGPPVDRAPPGKMVYTPSWHDALTKLGIPEWLNPL